MNPTEDSSKELLFTHQMLPGHDLEPARVLKVLSHGYAVVVTVEGTENSGNFRVILALR